MPWIVQRGTDLGCSASKPWGVFVQNEDGSPGDRLGCHRTKREAQAQQAALYVAERQARDSMSENRETRSFDLNRVNIRQKDDTLVFRGHAAVFNSPAELGTFTEVVEPGAFKRSLEEGRDVIFTLDHSPEKLLARTSSGTLKLKEDAKGLAVEATLPDTTYARDAAELVSRGDLSGMSFIFQAKEQRWDLSSGKRTRYLSDVDLFDVSIVALPAYPATDLDVDVRMITDALMEARSGKAISAKNKEAILSAIATLQALIAEGDENVDLNPRSLLLELMAKA